MQIPSLEPLDQYYPYICKMVAETSWLPHPDTVRALGRAVFPTSRARKQHPRLQNILENEKPIGMYDDNTTPTWAILWAHGLRGGSRTGWEFAHVWNVSDDIDSYTHLANLAMIPECFASLTDKTGPLTRYLKWHAWTIYGWKPGHAVPPEAPEDYGKILWRYLPKIDAPVTFIRTRFDKLDNERTRILKALGAAGRWV